MANEKALHPKRTNSQLKHLNPIAQKLLPPLLVSFTSNMPPLLVFFTNNLFGNVPHVTCALVMFHQQ